MPEAQAVSPAPAPALPALDRSPAGNVLALQRLIGNAAVSRLISRQPATTTPPTTTPTTAPPATPPAPGGGAAAPVPAGPAPVIGRVVTAATPIVGTPGGANLWTSIRSQFAEPHAARRGRTRTGDPLEPVMVELYSATTFAELHALDAAARATALNEIFNQLAPVVAPAGPGGAAPTLDEEIAAEEALVSARIRDNSQGGWRGVRQGILSAFGVFEVGTTTAIDRANAYYAQLVPSQLFGQTGSLVHPVMQARLGAATTSIGTPPEPERTEIVSSIGTPGGFYIRPNANNAWVLSFHSFGWAVDLSATLNPNAGSSTSAAMEPVAAVTGRANPGAAETEGLTAAEAQAVAQELLTTSQSYVAAMENETTISAALRGIANRARTAATLADLPGDGTDILAAADQGRTGSRNAVLAIIAAGAPTPRPAGLTTAANSILSATRAFRASFTRRGGRAAATVTATPGSVAAHGFMNLSPRLVGALTGTDAGNLNWLGTSSVADYMHFELHASMRSNLLTTPAAAAPAGGLGEPHPGPGGAGAGGGATPPATHIPAAGAGGGGGGAGPEHEHGAPESPAGGMPLLA